LQSELLRRQGGRNQRHAGRSHDQSEAIIHHTCPDTLFVRPILAESRSEIDTIGLKSRILGRFGHIWTHVREVINILYIFKSRKNNVIGDLSDFYAERPKMHEIRQTPAPFKVQNICNQDGDRAKQEAGSI
jgi:hypothetical protein